MWARGSSRGPGEAVQPARNALEHRLVLGPLAAKLLDLRAESSTCSASTVLALEVGASLHALEPRAPLLERRLPAGSAHRAPTWRASVATAPPRAARSSSGGGGTWSRPAKPSGSNHEAAPSRRGCTSARRGRSPPRSGPARRAPRGRGTRSPTASTRRSGPASTPAPGPARRLSPSPRAKSTNGIAEGRRRLVPLPELLRPRTAPAPRRGPATRRGTGNGTSAWYSPGRSRRRATRRRRRPPGGALELEISGIVPATAKVGAVEVVRGVRHPLRYEPPVVARRGRRRPAPSRTRGRSRRGTPSASCCRRRRTSTGRRSSRRGARRGRGRRSARRAPASPRTSSAAAAVALGTRPAGAARPRRARRGDAGAGRPAPGGRGRRGTVTSWPRFSRAQPRAPGRSPRARAGDEAEVEDAAERRRPRLDQRVHRQLALGDHLLVGSSGW